MKHQFAKLTAKGEILFPPINGPDGRQINYFVDEKKLTEDGFLPYISSPRPVNDKQYKAVYEIIKGKICQRWDEVILEPMTPNVETSEVLRRRAYEAETDGLEVELAYKTRKAYPMAVLTELAAEIDKRREAIKIAFPDISE